MRLIVPWASSAPVPPLSARVPPVRSTGLPDSAPPDWVKVPLFSVRVPVSVRVPADWVKPLDPLRASAPHWPR